MLAELGGVGKETGVACGAGGLTSTDDAVSGQA